MKTRERLISLLVLVGLLAGCQSETDQQSADLVLLGGKIVTMDDARAEAQALAVTDGKLVAVGSDREIDEFVGESTEVIHLGGALAIPGFIEGHGHFFRFGEVLTQLDLTQAMSWNDIVEMVASAARTAKPGEWIIGWGWHQGKWTAPPNPSVEGLPKHEGLSQVSPHNPVLLGHASGHGILVNARALELGGISRVTPDPPGGEIVRDAAGNPIGMLRETAAELVEEAHSRYLAQRAPEVIEAEMRRHVHLAAEASIANGITSFQDMGSTFEEIDLLKKLAAEGNLPLRLYVAIQEPSEEMRDKLAEYRMVNYADGYLTVRTIGEKVLDGALGTHGGWLLEPYSDLPRSVGLNVTPVEEIERSAELAIEHDYQMAIQGIGDRAARVLFDTYETAFRRHPEKRDLRWRIEHAQVIHPDDLPRFAELGVIPSIQGIFACSDGQWVEERLGEQRTRERGYVFKSMIESGAVVTNGTDPPVEPIDPIASFHCSVTRELPDGSLFYPEQKMTREEALKSYTINNAYAAFEESSKGSLTPGKLADITVLSKDILTVPADEIRSSEVVYTIIGGKVKYRKAGREGKPRS